MSLERFARKEVSAVTPQTSLAEVAKLMEARHVGAVVVVEGRRPVGIITDRDLAVRVVAHSLPPSVPVVQVMTRDPVVMQVGRRVDEALFAMRKAGIRRLPIVDDAGALVGMITLDDVLVLLSAELNCGVDAVLDNRGP